MSLLSHERYTVVQGTVISLHITDLYMSSTNRSGLYTFEDTMGICHVLHQSQIIDLRDVIINVDKDNESLLLMRILILFYLKLY